jgi:hypothetical protein
LYACPQPGISAERKVALRGSCLALKTESFLASLTVALSFFGFKVSSSISLPRLEVSFCAAALKPVADKRKINMREKNMRIIFNLPARS